MSPGQMVHHSLNLQESNLMAAAISPLYPCSACTVPLFKTHGKRLSTLQMHLAGSHASVTCIVRNPRLQTAQQLQRQMH